jgi:hypothetical protein
VLLKGFLAATTAALVCVPATALAGGIVTSDFVDPSLKVNVKGIALVQYTERSGTAKHVLLWGAVNGAAHAPAVQATFRTDYTGGWKSQKNASYWKPFKNA